MTGCAMAPPSALNIHIKLTEWDEMRLASKTDCVYLDVFCEWVSIVSGPFRTPLLRAIKKARLNFFKNGVAEQGFMCQDLLQVLLDYHGLLE